MERCTILQKGKGHALLSIVLVSFIVLSVFSFVIFSISMRTLNVEIWQTKHYEKLRLSYIARSAANSVVEAISADLAALGAFPVNKHSTATISSISPTEIDIVISGDVSPHLIVKAKAANEDDQSVTVTIRYNIETRKIIQWRDDQ